MKTLKTKLIAIIFFYLPVPFMAQESYGEIRGIIKNTNLEVIPFATIKILLGNQLIGGTQSDERGRYNYKPLNAGTYEIIVMNVEYMTQPVKGVVVKPNEATYLDVKLNPNTMETVTVVASALTYTPPGVDKKMYSMVSIDYKELRLNSNYVPGNIATAIVAMTSDVVEADGELHFRGSRGDATASYIDGVRTLAPTTVPGLAIENLTIYTGGVPACYGDVTGGVVVITTKSYFSGIRDKNMRNAEYREKAEEEKRAKKAKEDEENRLKEIEAEKAKEKKKDTE